MLIVISEKVFNHPISYVKVCLIAMVTELFFLIKRMCSLVHRPPPPLRLLIACSMKKWRERPEVSYHMICRTYRFLIQKLIHILSAAPQKLEKFQRFFSRFKSKVLKDCCHMSSVLLLLDISRTSLGNSSELDLLLWVCFTSVMWLSAGTCSIFISGTEHKIGLVFFLTLLSSSFFSFCLIFENCCCKPS